MQSETSTAMRNTDLEAAVQEAREAYAAQRPKSAAAHQRAQAVMPNGNTRSNLAYAPFPTAMARGEGCWLEDIDGHRYLDLCGEYTAGLFGHSNARIRAALDSALDRGIGLAAVGEREAEFAEILCQRFPSIEKVRFTNSGTEANLMAIAAARHYTGRPGLLAMRNGYHGGVLTFAGGGSPVNAPFPVTLAPYNDVEGTLTLLRAHAQELAAVILEPMVGGGGCIPASVEFLSALRAATQELGIVLIFDEVMSSRHAAGGLQQLRGITPDMTTLGKYMAGGMSFGAFGGRAAIMDQYDSRNPGALPHSGTFNNNVLTMAAGPVAMGEIFTAAVADTHRARGDALRTRLNAACATAGATMQFTGIGSMMQVHFRTTPISEPYSPTSKEEKLRELFFFDMLQAGVYLARRGMVAMSLPVGDAECATFVAAVERFCAMRSPLLG